MKISLFKGILFGVFSISALIGLFVFATHTGTTTTNSTIGTVVIWGTLPKGDIQSVLTQAGQADTSLNSVTYVQKDSTTVVTDLATAIATGNAPDLILASQEQLYALTKFLMPLPLATLSTRTFTETFIEEGTIFTAPGGAGYYGIPFLVDPLVLFYNRNILASSGIAKPPATWEALIGLVPKVAELTPSRQIKRGLIALGTYDNVTNARAILSTLFLQTDIPVSGYSAAGVLTANLGASNNTASGQAVLGFYTQFTDPSKVSYTWNASLKDSVQAFLAGDLALYLGFASEARFLTSANPNLGFAVATIPQPATASAKRTYGLVYSFMIPRGAKNSAGGYQAAALLTGSAVQIIAAEATGLAPATLTQLATVPADPVAAVASAEALYAKGWLSPVPSDTNRVFSGMIGDVISGRSSLETALASAERTLTALLQQ